MNSYGPVSSINILNYLDGPKDIDCCASEEILISMTLNLYIHSRNSRSGVGEVKVHKGKHYMYSYMRYNIMVVFYHWKVDQMKIYQKKMAHQKSVHIYVTTMNWIIPSYGLESIIG